MEDLDGRVQSAVLDGVAVVSDDVRSCLTELDTMTAQQAHQPVRYTDTPAMRPRGHLLLQTPTDNTGALQLNFSVPHDYM